MLTCVIAVFRINLDGYLMRHPPTLVLFSLWDLGPAFCGRNILGLGITDVVFVVNYFPALGSCKEKIIRSCIEKIIPFLRSCIEQIQMKRCQYILAEKYILYLVESN